MPSVQRGSVVRHGSGWSARYYDEANARRRKGGFATLTDALEWLGRKLDQVEALRNGDVGAVRRQTMPTLRLLVDEYLDQHSAEANTLRTLRERLRYATDTFGDTRVDRLDPQQIGAWRKRLPERSAWGIHKALRQVLHHAVRVKLLAENPAVLVPNPEPKRREVPTFATVAELDAVADELLPRFRPIPVFVGLTGLRPEEWLALERGDVDQRAGVVHIRRVFTDGQVKLYGKQDRSLRAVPLPLRAAEALEELPARVDTRLLFPGERGGYLNLHNWRAHEWTLPFVPRGSPTVRPTRSGTRSLRPRSPRACRCSSSPASWAPRRSRSTARTDTSSPTRSTVRGRRWIRSSRRPLPVRRRADEAAPPRRTCRQRLDPGVEERGRDLVARHVAS